VIVSERLSVFNTRSGLLLAPAVRQRRLPPARTARKGISTARFRYPQFGEPRPAMHAQALVRPHADAQRQGPYSGAADRARVPALSDLENMPTHSGARDVVYASFQRLSVEADSALIDHAPAFTRRRDQAELVK
jgi:hypothetical protein